MAAAQIDYHLSLDRIFKTCFYSLIQFNSVDDICESSNLFPVLRSIFPATDTFFHSNIHKPPAWITKPRKSVENKKQKNNQKATLTKGHATPSKIVNSTTLTSIHWSEWKVSHGKANNLHKIICSPNFSVNSN